MRPVAELLQELKARDVLLSAVGDQLKCDAPPGALTNELRQRLRDLKPEILRLLAASPDAAAVPEDGAEPSTEAGEGFGALSRAQRAIWFLEQITPGTATWNVASAFDVRGQLDRAALEASFRLLLRRHAPLRSRFVPRSGSRTADVETVAFPVEDWHLAFEDLSALPDAMAEAAALSTAMACRPFDLTQEPPCRASLLRVAADRHRLTIVLHHIAADGWSLGLVGRELGLLYAALRRGDAPALPPIRASYARFVDLERREEMTDAADLAWWGQQLAGDLPDVSLARERGRAPSGAGRRLEIGIDRDLKDKIQSLARQHHATPYMVTLAAFKLLAHRYTGQSDILVGTAVSGRDRPGFDEVVGMFVNTLVLRTTVAPEVTFVSLLERVRDTVLQAFAHQHVAFDRLVETVRPPRVAGVRPIVRLMFAYQNVPGAALALDGATVVRQPLELTGAHDELAVEIWPTVDGLSCQFEYATDLFDEETIRSLMAHYVGLLKAAVADPERPVGRLDFLTDRERKRLDRFNDTAVSYPAGTRIEHLFEASAAQCPLAPAIRHRGREISYGDLDRRANRLAHHLRGLGVGPGVLVGICLKRSPDLIVALLAALKAGGAYLPLDPAYPAQRLEYMLQDSGASVLVTRAGVAPSITPPTRVVDLDQDAAVISAEPATSPTHGGTATDLAYVIYTSGSTGRPKGAMLRHSAVNLAHWSIRTFGRESFACVAAPTSVCFDLSVLEIFVTLAAGGTILLIENPLERIASDERPTMFSAVPSLVAELVRSRNIPSSVRVIVTGGERLKRSLVDDVYAHSGVERFYNIYGPTEFTTCCTAALTERDADRDPSVGPPLDNTRLYVLDPQRELLPPGVAGELYIAGDGLGKGYVNRPELTAERFVPNPFGPAGSLMYKTGDQVRWTTTGALDFVARIDHQVKLRGFRIELGEIEAALLRHPDVREAAVVLRDDLAGGSRLVAFVLSATGACPGDLKRLLGEWLPDFMIPSHFKALPSFPQTPSGKLDREALQRMEIARAPVRESAVPMTPLEYAVAGAFSDVLGTQVIDAEADFFTLGGHSLLAMQLAARLSEQLDASVSPALVFQAPTPRGLAGVLDGELQAPKEHLRPLQASGTQAPVFCVSDITGRSTSYILLARHLEPDQPLYVLCPGPLEVAFVADPSVELLTSAYVAEVRRVQPRGPYRIGGYSSGGFFAFELAQSLRAEGEEVELIMLDPYLMQRRPGAWAMCRFLGRWTRRSLRVGVREGFRLRQLRRVLLDWVRSGEHLPDFAIPSWLPVHSRALAAASMATMQTHKLRPFEGRTTFIQASRRGPPEELMNGDRLNGWAALISGPVTRIAVETDHSWMMRAPAVAGVADLLRGKPG